jgi:TPR repeat
MKRSRVPLVGLFLVLSFSPFIDAKRSTWHESITPGERPSRGPGKNGSTGVPVHANLLAQSDDPLSSAPAYIDAITPPTLPSGSPDTQCLITGTGLNQIEGVYLLDPKDNWVAVPFVKRESSTQATVVLSSSYLIEPRFLPLSAAPDLRYAQSMLVYSPQVAQAAIDRTFKITVVPEDIGNGGTISVTGTGLVSGMQVVLGHGDVAGIILSTQFAGASYLTAEVPEYIPGNDLFTSVLSADGKKRSAPFGVTSSYPEREDELSQQASASPSDLNREGLQLTKRGEYAEAALKFVEAARLDWSSSGIWYGPKGSARFSNNAGFAFYKIRRYPEAVVWLQKTIEIDPNRAVAYLNLGDALVKLNRNAEARQAYMKYLELAPDSKAAPDVKRKLDALTPSP